MSSPKTPRNAQFVSYKPPSSASKKRKSAFGDPNGDATRARLTEPQKLEQFIDFLDRCNWTLGTLLKVLFDPEKVRSDRHNGVVRTLLNGTERIKFVHILDLVYQSSVDLEYRSDDTQHPRGVFDKSLHYTDIQHAHPALNAWAISLAGEFVRKEGKKMASRETGFHLPASRKAPASAPVESQPLADPMPSSSAGLQTSAEKEDAAQAYISWTRLNAFNLDEIQRQFESDSAVTWYILEMFTGAEELVTAESPPSSSAGVVTGSGAGSAVAVKSKRLYRPKEIALTFRMAELVFLRSKSANLLPLIRGIWLYASKAHQSIFRVESRLGQAVAYETVRSALHNMSEAARDEMRRIIAEEPGRWFDVVADNVQAWIKQRDPRLGRENHMIKGFAGTAIELQDFQPEALRLQPLLDRQALMERKQLTADMILDDIDFGHLTHVAIGQFLQALITFVPTLSRYQKDVDRYYKNHVQKHQINPTRHTKIYPLATNSADEMTVQGMKQGVLDFLQTQMGINEDTLDGRPFVFSGDGKTFDVVHHLRKYLSPHISDFEALRFLVALLELWHAKWTDLSRTIRSAYGKDYPRDPSTLQCLANAANCPTFADLRKVDFNAGSHVLDLALDAHLLVAWEVILGTQNLVAHFEELDKSKHLPSFERLVVYAQILAKRYGVGHAFERERKPGPAPSSDGEPPDITEVPRGSPWTAPPHVIHTAVPPAAASGSDTPAKTKKQKGKKKKAPAQVSVDIPDNLSVLSDASLSSEILQSLNLR